jgi:hypothetical protein
MRLSRKCWTAAAAFAAALAWPARADAHLVTTGLGPVYDGIGHWATTPEDIIPVVALAILAGLRGAQTGRRLMFIVPVTWLFGGLVGMLIATPPGLSRPVLSGIISATFLAPGLLALSDLPVPSVAVAVLAAIVGVVHGFLDAGGLRSEGATTTVGILQFVGMTLELFVLMTLLAAFVLSLRQPWTRVAARVAGSWIAAAGLLLLGWSLRGVG